MLLTPQPLFNPMNAQTQGPAIEHGNRIITPSGKAICAIPSRLNDANEWEHRTPENAANAALLAASYTLIDSAARALNVEAIDLARIDLAWLIRSAILGAALAGEAGLRHEVERRLMPVIGAAAYRAAVMSPIPDAPSGPVLTLPKPQAVTT